MIDPRAQPANARPPTLPVTLADRIEQQIADGAYATGDRLPSLREFAQRHRLSKNTVVAAFELLVARGLVEPRRGSGYYVRERPARSKDDDRANLGRAMDIVWLMREQLGTRPDELAVGDGFAPVSWLADLRLDRYHPKVVRTGLGALYRYGSRFGYEPLRAHLVRRLADHGIGAEPRQVLLTQGANGAMDIVIRYFVPPGGVVLVDDPGYYPLFGKLRLAGAVVHGVPRCADGPDLDVLEQLLVAHRPRLFFTQTLGQNPTGSDTSAAKAFRLLQLAHKHDLILVENDPLADFRPVAAPRLSALDQLTRTIYVGTFSKSFSAALRVGFIACEAGLASDLADLKALVHINSSEYCERTVDVMLGEGHYQRHVARLRDRLEEANVRAQRLFDSIGADVFAPGGRSLYVWASLPGVADSVALAGTLLPRKVMLAPGRIFRVDAGTVSPWSRFNVGAVADPRFMQALGPALHELAAAPAPAPAAASKG